MSTQASSFLFQRHVSKLILSFTHLSTPLPTHLPITHHFYLNNNNFLSHVSTFCLFLSHPSLSSANRGLSLSLSSAWPCSTTRVFRLVFRVVPRTHVSGAAALALPLRMLLMNKSNRLLLSLNQNHWLACKKIHEHLKPKVGY